MLMLTANWCCRIGLTICLGLVIGGCQTAGNEGEFRKAIEAGFDAETGAALPNVPETTQQKTNIQNQVGSYDSDNRYNAEDWSADRYEVLPIAPNERPNPGTDEAGIWFTADKVEAHIMAQANRITDPALTQYVTAVVCRVAGTYCPDARTYIIRIPEFNASMMPNGLMQVWSGLLIRITSEAEMASVFGHEIGHYLLRHGVIGHRRRVDMATSQLIIGVMAGAAGVPSISDINSIMAAGTYFEHSRDQERQADGYGYLLMTRAGYDPIEAPAIWQFLSDEIEAMGKDDVMFFGRTHPINEERYVMGRKLAEELKAKAGKPLEFGQDRYVQAILPHRAQFLQDELGKRQFSAFQLILDKWRDVGVKNGEIEFFQGELYRTRSDPEENDLENAASVYEFALTLPGAPERIYRSMGLVYKKLNQHDDMNAAFRKYLELVPDAQDASLIKMMLAENIS
jgi:beta-barrel assembly-enhancing protease